MRSATSDLTISTARADALFASPLQRSDQPGPAQVHQAIAAAVAAFGIRGCAARVAQAYGEHPETAVLRMRWARAAVTRGGHRRRGHRHVRRRPHRAGLLRPRGLTPAVEPPAVEPRAPRALPGRPGVARPKPTGPGPAAS